VHRHPPNAKRLRQRHAGHILHRDRVRKFCDGCQLRHAPDTGQSLEDPQFVPPPRLRTGAKQLLDDKAPRTIPQDKRSTRV